MNIVLRYACLLGLGLASLAAFITAGAVTGQLVISGGEQASVRPHELGVWVLGLVTALSLLSAFRVRIPFIIRDWIQDRREKLATLAMAGVICFMFVVL